jgi:3-hydroxy acid dehydrogenase/malonic semialdehyde reductase
MVETEFSIIRFRGDKARADNEYHGLTPCKLHPHFIPMQSLVMEHALTIAVTGGDIAEEIVWCASRPDHVQVAQMRKQFQPFLTRRIGSTKDV